MKFLSTHARTRLALVHWAGSKKLVLASCFFWYAGSRLQKSQEGLLRSLLFEILRQCPEISPLVSDLRIELKPYEKQDWPWTFTDLLYVCQKVVEVSTDIAFCFFIDGLDECDEDGMSQVDLIKNIRRSSSYPNVKMCVSSRPWPVFADAFHNDPDLKLEDLTRNDIKRYVNDHFDQSVPFRKLKDTNPLYPALLRCICSQAQGVFLWVHLVVRDLLDGLTHGEDPQSLLNRLRGFPRDLNEFCQHMIDTIDPQYLPQTPRTLDIAIGAKEPLSMIVYSFIDEVENNPNFPLHLGDNAMPETEFDMRVDLMQRRLIGRCKGLLEIGSRETSIIRFEPTGGPYVDLKVDFIHRTVFEFLHNSTSVQSLIGLHTTSPNTPLLLCRAFVAVIKRLPSSFRTRPVGIPMHDFFENLFYFASKAELDRENRDEIIELLKSCEYTFHQGIAVWEWEKEESEFLGLACKAGVLCYANVRLRQPEIQQWINGAEIPLLDYVLYCWDFVLECWEGILVRAVETLLKAGADPNQPFNDSTIWGKFMGQIWENREFRDQPGTFKALELLVANGADLRELASTERQVLLGIRRMPRMINRNRFKHEEHIVTTSDVIKPHNTKEQFNSLKRISASAGRPSFLRSTMAIFR